MARAVIKPAKPEVNFTVSQKQADFINCKADEVLFGGAAGGGKSYGQLIDTFTMAMRYPGIKQLLLRESFPELRRSLILSSFMIFPAWCGTYSAEEYKWKFINGSTVEFGYLDSDESVQIYQSAEYDTIRFDEGTHFNEFRYMYMKSRCRGANDFPKQMKISTNPGGIGHAFFKARFRVGEEKPNETFTVYIGRDEKGTDFWETRCFIPSRVYDNQFLLDRDPNYIKNLLQLPEKERKALLEGNWDLFEGQAFPEWSYEIHTCDAVPIPEHWRRWMSVDNGHTDPFAWYWHAVDEEGNVYTYREYTRSTKDSKVVYSEQAKKVLELSRHMEIVGGQEVETQEKIGFVVAGHDAFNTHPLSEQGKSIIDHYNEGGLHGFVKAITDRRLRKSVIHEYLRPFDDDVLGRKRAKWMIFRNCKQLIKTMPEQIQDPGDSEKYAETDNDHWIDGAGYGLLAYHAKRSWSATPEKSDMEKDRDRLWKKQNRPVASRRYA